MRVPAFLFALSFALPACAQTGPAAPRAGDNAPDRRPAEQRLFAQAGGPVDPHAGVPGREPERVVPVPALPLTKDILYKILLAEVAGQRGNVRLSARAYVDLAQSTRDPRLARRATEVALGGRLNDVAAEAASVWLEIDPDSPQARQTLVSALVGNNRVSEARAPLRKMLAADRARAAAVFLQLGPLLARQSDRKAVLDLVRELAQPYATMAEARFAVAQAAAMADDATLAESEVEEALRLRSDLEPAALLKAQVLQRTSLRRAADFLGAFAAAHPKAREARMVHARLLAADRRPAEAREAFKAIEREFPENAELSVMIGLLSLQMHDFPQAEVRLKRALELNYRDPDTLRFYLGQITEEAGRLDEALQHYAEVRGGDQVATAAGRFALILARRGQIDAARGHLQSIEPQNERQAAGLAQAEAQVLREAKLFREAFDVMEAALSRQPDNADLLYDSAMAAEKIDRLDLLESRLMRLIQLKPDHAQAYNALGYSLADRNLRLDEARGLIEKALSLLPEDAFILDSMGWVLFRQGRLEEGLEHLRRAHAQRPDPEISAHLGEVLWALGRKDEAEKLLRSALAAHPASTELQDVAGRLLK